MRLLKYLIPMPLLVALGGCMTAEAPSSDPQAWPPEGGSRDGGGLFYDFPAYGPTNALQLELTPVADTFRRPDSVLVKYVVRNTGPDQAFRDFSDFYYFKVIGPDGNALMPIFYEETYGMGAGRLIHFAHGATTEVHAINLACMPYHALTFDPVFPWSEPLVAAPEGLESFPCQLVYDFTEPGRYLIIGQHIPAQPDGVEGDPEFMPSRADTAEIVLWPDTTRRWGRRDDPPGRRERR